MYCFLLHFLSWFIHSVPYSLLIFWENGFLYLSWPIKSRNGDGPSVLYGMSHCIKENMQK